MKLFGGFFIGFFTFILMLSLSFRIGDSVGPGPYDVGLILVAISLLGAIMTTCTFIIVNAIERHKKNN